METSGKLIKRPKTLIAAAMIVAAGVFGAFQFRLRAPAPPSIDSPPGPWRAEDVGSGVIDTPNAATQPAATPALAGRLEPVGGSSAGGRTQPLIESAAAGKRDRYADIQLDETLLPSHGAFDSSASLPPVDSSHSLAGNGLGSRLADDVEGLSSLHEPIAVHKVVDGDTLVKLAEKYLGRADRYVDLFHYNRDVLRDPNVLPIGSEIRIPPPSALLYPTVPTPSDPLVPLNPAPPVSPTATPRHPGNFQPAAANRNAPPASARPKTYTVQEGDNLVDIARKLYGDGRRYEQLFEANRQKLKTPLDIKPGVELVVP